MRFGIFADVHGNLQALQAVISTLDQQRTDMLFCVGDIVGYGADPGSCVDLIRNKKIISVAGNHDWAVVDKMDISYFNPIAKRAVRWTKDRLEEKDKIFLTDLELVFENEYFILVHGTLDHPEDFQYLKNTKTAAGNFNLMDRNVCFIAHSHVPGIYVQTGERIKFLKSLQVNVEPGSRYIVNVGSVGQPRDGNPLAAYCVFDKTNDTICIERVEYDVKEAQLRMINARLPFPLVFRLAIGR